VKLFTLSKCEALTATTALTTWNIHRVQCTNSCTKAETSEPLKNWDGSPPLLYIFKKHFAERFNLKQITMELDLHSSPTHSTV